MTVCIAAACRDNDEEKIVLCTDRKSNSVLGAAETARKTVWLPNKWRCLTAGTEADIIALTRLYKLEFKNKNNLEAETIDATIKRPLHVRKLNLAEEYVRRRFAISYDEFIKFGKERLPLEVFFDATQNIAQLELDAELILAGFIGKHAEIYYTDSKGVARAAYHFAVVGEGEYIASASLLRREQQDWLSLEETLYNVFEAKTLAERVGSVGKDTDMHVLSIGGRRLTSLELDKQLEEMFKKYGPQPLPEQIKFEGEYYYKNEE